MKTVYMCDICNKNNFSQFKELLENQGNRLVASCIEQCSNGKIAAKIGNETLFAESVEELAEKVAAKE